MSIIVLIIFIAIIAYLMFNTFFIVNQQTVAVIERLGKFARVAHPGFNIKIPFIEMIKGRLSLRIHQLDVPVETKTKDNVFVKVSVSVQYLILPEKVYAAFYRLSQQEVQIESFIFDVVRAQVPKMDLDDVFEKKDDIAFVVKDDLTDQMTDFGYSIVKALVTDIEPNAKVRAAMNEINEQQRLRLAAEQKGEAEKILKVKRAEADAESMRLSGLGMAEQRKAIIDGLKASVDDFRQSVPGVSASDVMSLVLITQYYDTLKEIGAQDKSHTILLPHSLQGLNDLASQLRDGVITGNLTTQQSAQG